MECCSGVKNGVPLVLFSMWIQLVLIEETRSTQEGNELKSSYLMAITSIKTCLHISAIKALIKARTNWQIVT